MFRHLFYDIEISEDGNHNIEGPEKRGEERSY
jgi:hypothetical protein